MNLSNVPQDYAKKVICDYFVDSLVLIGEKDAQKKYLAEIENYIKSSSVPNRKGSFDFPKNRIDVLYTLSNAKQVKCHLPSREKPNMIVTEKIEQILAEDPVTQSN